MNESDIRERGVGDICKEDDTFIVTHSPSYPASVPPFFHSSLSPPHLLWISSSLAQKLWVAVHHQMSPLQVISTNKTKVMHKSWRNKTFISHFLDMNYLPCLRSYYAGSPLDFTCEFTTGHVYNASSLVFGLIWPALWDHNGVRIQEIENAYTCIWHSIMKPTSIG